MQRPPSPNYGTVNLLIKQERVSKVNPIKPFYPKPRYSDHAPKTEPFCCEQIEMNQVYSNYPPLKRNLTESFLPQKNENVKIIGIILYILLLVLVLVENLGGYYLLKSWHTDNRIFIIASAQILYILVLKYLHIIETTTLKQIWQKIRGQQSQKTKSINQFFKHYQNGSTHDTDLISKMSYPNFSWKSFIMTFFFSIAWIIFYGKSLSNETSLHTLFYALTLIPYVLLRIQTQLNSKTTNVILTIIIFFMSILTFNSYLITASLCGCYINTCTKTNKLMYSLSLYISLIFALVFFIMNDVTLFSGFGNFISFIVIIVLLLGSMLITRYVANQSIRKELYKYYILDYQIDCLICLLPILIMIISGLWSYFFIGGCITMFILCYIFRNDNTITFDEN